MADICFASNQHALVDFHRLTLTAQLNWVGHEVLSAYITVEDLQIYHSFLAQLQFPGKLLMRKQLVGPSVHEAHEA